MSLLLGSTSPAHNSLMYAHRLTNFAKKQQLYKNKQRHPNWRRKLQNECRHHSNKSTSKAKQQTTKRMKGTSKSNKTLKYFANAKQNYQRRKNFRRRSARSFPMNCSKASRIVKSQKPQLRNLRNNSKSHQVINANLSESSNRTSKRLMTAISSSRVLKASQKT